VKPLRPKRCRWYSIPDVLEQILKRTNKFARRIAGKPRRQQLQAVRRLVMRAEQRDESRLTKRMGREIYVKADAIEELLPDDLTSLGRLESQLVEVASFAKRISVLQSGHGNRLRQHDSRLAILEQKQALTSRYISEIARLDSAG
jgi:hypothetical protein